MHISDLHTLFLESEGICTDTRNIVNGSIFFALKGGNFNGNLFAEQAVNEGCSYAVVDEVYSENKQLIPVENVLACLQELATYHRRQLGVKIIGITGSNGKTTTKELLYAVLSKKFNTLATEGNFNNHIGVPLTLLRLNSEHEVGIIEMGANHVGEIGELASMATPDVGLITNIGKAHLEGFGSVEGVIQAKTELYRQLEKDRATVLYNRSNALLKEQVDKLANVNLVSYGTSDDALYNVHLIESDPYLKAEVFSDGNSEGKVSTKLAGSYNLENIAAAYAVGKYFAVEFSQIAEALENYVPTNSRSQLVKTNLNTILIDAYNANPSSMKLALQEFDKYNSKQAKIAILGGMKELGSYNRAEHKQLIQLVRDFRFKKVILVGEEYSGISHDYLWFSTTEEAKRYLQDQPLKDAFVLIKGSRSNKLETLIPFL